MCLANGRKGKMLPFSLSDFFVGFWCDSPDNDNERSNDGSNFTPLHLNSN